MVKTSPSLTLRNLPAFSPVATKLLSVLRRDEVNFKEAADLIKSDAGISAEVLRLANSPMSDLRFRPSSILQTISLLGTKRVASLIATLCLGKLLARVSKLPLMRRCWRNNLATALIAERWGEQYGIESENAYMLGLLAGLGRLALLASQPDAYTKLVQRAEEGGTPLEALETEVFGFDHREAGCWLVSEWKLPIELLEVFSAESSSPSTPKLASLILSAANEAVRLGFGVLEGVPCDPPDPDSFQVALSVNRIEQGLGI